MNRIKNVLLEMFILGMITGIIPALAGGLLCKVLGV